MKYRNKYISPKVISSLKVKEKYPPLNLIKTFTVGLFVEQK